MNRGMVFSHYSDLLRVLQGLALGGEYGGAAVYVAEHVPDDKRGFYTSFIQITATLGLFVSIAVIIGTQNNVGSSFQRVGLAHSFPGFTDPCADFLVHPPANERIPIFQQIKSTGMTSAAPLKEAFTVGENFKRFLITLFGATAGQGVVWYTGQFFALFFMQTILKVPARDANIIVAKALLIGMPLFVLFGWLSDRIGRKKIIMAG